MKHYLLNITWACQLQCSYCWMRRHIDSTPGLRHAPLRSFDDWARAIERDPPDTMEIAGGEPLLVPWCLDLIASFPHIRVGLSTNGLCEAGIEALLREPLPNIININLSYHPEAAQADREYDNRWKRQIRWLRAAGYALGPNIQNTEWNLAHSRQIREWGERIGQHIIISPMCGGREENKHRQPVGLVCESGINHITVIPDGRAWPCLNALWSEEWEATCLGNWLDGTLDMSRKPVPCYLWCSDYEVVYAQHEGGDQFYSNVRPYREATCAR